MSREEKEKIERIVVSRNNTEDGQKVANRLAKVADLIATDYEAFLKTTKPFSL